MSPELLDRGFIAACALGGALALALTGVRRRVAGTGRSRELAGLPGTLAANGDWLVALGFCPLAALTTAWPPLGALWPLGIACMLARRARGARRVRQPASARASVPPNQRPSCLRK